MTWLARIGLAAGLVLISATSALAVDYRVASENARGLALVDADSVVQVGADQRQATITVVLPTPSGKTFQVLVAPVLIDCSQPRYRLGVVELFDLDLVPLFRDAGDPEAWSTANAQSPFTPTAAFVCRGEALPRPQVQDLKAIVKAYVEQQKAGAQAP